MRTISFVLLATALSQPPAPGPKPTPNRVAALAYSPDGSKLAIAVGQHAKDQPGRVSVRDVATGAVSWTVELNGANSIAFTTDGKTLLAAGATLLALDPATGKQIAECKHDSAVTAVAVGPKGRFVTAGDDKTVRVWDEATFKELLKIESGAEPLFRLAFSTDGSRILGSSQNVVRSQEKQTSVSSTLWNAKDGAVVKKFDDESSYIAGAAFSADGRSLIRCIGNSGELTIHDTATGAESCRLGGRSGMDHFAFCPRTNLAATSGTSDEMLTLYPLRFDPPAAAEKERIESHVKQFDADAIADRETAATALFEFGLAAEPFLKKAMTDSPNAEIRLRARKALIQWREKGHRKIPISSARTSALTLSPDGRFAAWGVSDGTVRVVDLKTEKIVSEWKIEK